MPKLTPEERNAALANLDGWAWDETHQGISRSFRFADFAAAFAFMTRVAMLAEKVDHHPDWSNRWNQVDILLTTHNAGGLTRRDIELAQNIDTILA